MIKISISYSGSLIYENWFDSSICDTLHREDGPAYIECFEDQPLVVSWIKNGKHHRKNGPARKCYLNNLFNNTTLHSIEWYDTGILHRKDGPAVTVLNTNGSYYEEWFIHGVKDRLNGPAFIEYDKNKNIKRQEWWSENKIHRMIQPAVLLYEGEKIYECWFFKGERMLNKSHPFFKFKEKYNLPDNVNDWNKEMKILYTIYHR